MNIIDRGQRFLHSLRDLFERKAWEWRRCPRCGDSLTCKWGSYERRPWCFEGRKRVRVQRHRCRRCQATYSESSALLVRGSWYAREVHRSAIDHWQHLGSSLRRSAEVMRSWLGRQERWQLWRPWDAVAGERCYLSASTVHRWLDGAGQRARQGVAGQLAGVPTSGQVGTDGLWARLRGGAKQVVLGLVDSVSGLVWPPVVVQGEEKAETWGQLFRRAQAAGLDLDQLRGVTSDGAKGLVGYLNQGLGWVNHQRCVFHLWRNLAGELAQVVKQGTEGLVGKAARKLGRQVRKEWVALIRGVWDAPSMAAAQEALTQLAARPGGKGLAKFVEEHLEAALVYRLGFNQGLGRGNPEWCWRDFRLRLSRGRNHGSPQRLERAALVWAIYHNFTPAQWRSERKRRYRRPGLSPLEMAGATPQGVSYLDALEV